MFVWVSLGVFSNVGLFSRLHFPPGFCSLVMFEGFSRFFYGTLQG